MGTLSGHTGLPPIPLTVDSNSRYTTVSASGVYGPSGNLAWDMATLVPAGVHLGDAYGTFGLQVNLSYTTAPTGFSAQLQGSLDGLNWFTLGAALTGTGSVQYASISDSPAKYVRLNLSVTGGAGVQVGAWLGTSE